MGSQARNNHIQSLPSGLSALGSLLRFELGVNELSHVPVCLRHLTRLRTLDLRSNALVGLPSWAQLPVSPCCSCGVCAPGYRLGACDSRRS